MKDKQKREEEKLLNDRKKLKEILINNEKDKQKIQGSRSHEP